MSSANPIGRRFRKCRRAFVGIGFAISLLSAAQSYAQGTTTPGNESQPAAGDDASAFLKDGPPLTAREEEMLRLIKGLQDRVARLEARDTSDSGRLRQGLKSIPVTVRRRGCWTPRSFRRREQIVHRALRERLLRAVQARRLRFPLLGRMAHRMRQNSGELTPPTLVTRWPILNWEI